MPGETTPFPREQSSSSIWRRARVRSDSDCCRRLLGRHSKRELSAGFLLLAWAVFFLLWWAVGSLVLAAIVFGVLMSGGIAVLNAS